MKWATVASIGFDPAHGSEASKVRPALLVSNDRAITSVERHRRGVVTVLPITSNITRVLGFQVLIAGDARVRCGLKYDSKIQVEQIRSVDFSRIREPIGELPPELHDEVREALRLHLDL